MVDDYRGLYIYTQCIGDYSCNYRGLFYPPKIGDYDNERGESRF
jgi:hypothetical protein